MFSERRQVSQGRSGMCSLVQTAKVVKSLVLHLAYMLTNSGQVSS